MKHFDNLWRQWLGLTLLFSLAVTLFVAGLFVYRGASSVEESRVIQLQSLHAHLSKEMPRIADELYLRLETLAQREEMLNDLLLNRGIARLQFTPEQITRNPDDSSFTRLQWESKGDESSFRIPIFFGDQSLGYLHTRVTWSPYWRSSLVQDELTYAAIASLLVIGLWAFLYWTIKKRVYAPAMKQFRERAAQEAHDKLARQVAHDIRSPLAALAVAESDFQVLPEDTRILVRSAVGRIQDIAHQLLKKEPSAHGGKVCATDTAEPAQTLLLTGLVESVLAEKRMQYRTVSNLEIGGYLHDSYGNFVRVQPIEFKRLLSNLINNGVEAMKEGGKVEIGIKTKEGESIELYVRDNGSGISREHLVQLGREGQTFGKNGGSGLGLFHARSAVERWGGRLEIDSTEGVGTTVVLRIPSAPAPDWFVETLRVERGTTVVALDDDESIHRIWNARFRLDPELYEAVSLTHFSSASELHRWVQGHPELASRATFLVDYELLGSGETGIEVVRRLGVSARSVLVTSRYEERDVRIVCSELNILMLPKDLAGFVPIRVVNMQGLRTASQSLAKPAIESASGTNR